MKNKLENFAYQIGFDKIGFVKIQDVEEEYKFYLKNLENWIENGFNNGMNYFLRNKEKRENPKILLENAKSIIVFAKKYHSNIKYTNKIKIAKYALAEEYHTLIKELLGKYDKFLSNEFNAKSKIFVDSGPIMEKVWAIFAGIGWFGKNGLILNEDLGSFFNLGILLTDLELETSKKKENKCNNCNICVESCPTSAIISPHKIDANKCISNHTIENREEKTEEINKKIKQTGYIFGCDVCQNVCPFNQKIIKNESEKNFNILKYLNLNKIEDIFDLTESDFNNLLINPEIKRTKYKNFLQNIKTVLKE